MSPKSRGRKRKPDKRHTRPPRTVAGPAPGVRHRDPAMDEIGQTFRAAAAGLVSAAESFRPLLGTADPLQVEIHTAQLLARLSGGDRSNRVGVAMSVMSLATQRPEPLVAAMTAAVNHFLPGMATRMALGELARAGVRPPAWHKRLGEVTPGRAWRYRDVFGDREALLVTFSYDGDSEHGILVETVTCPRPSVQAVQLSADVEALHAVAGKLGGGRVGQEVTLAQAAAALADVEHVHRDARAEDLVFLPVVERQVERLPEPVPTNEQVYTPEDRAAAVDSFLADAAGTAGVDHAVLRFWAQVLAGYTAASGSPPDRIGPAWLGCALEDHVPRTFDLTGQQRAGLVPAATAWSRWAARQQKLPEAAAGELAARVVEIDRTLDAAYADPDLAATRCYVSDVAAVTADGARLRRAFAVRSHAVPLPALRSAARRSLLASDPDHRRRILADALQAWELSADESAEDWSAALTSVSEQLWSEEPPELAEAVARYVEADGTDSELLADLTELAVAHADDRAGFLDAAYDRLEPLSEP